MNNYVESLRPKDFSDAGNAEVFVREYGDDLVFTDSMGWLYWDGKRWARDEHKALELAEDFTDQMLAKAKRLNFDAVHELADQTAAKDAETPDTAALDKAKKAAEAAKLYRSRENWLENFIDDCCERAEGARTGARELYLAYKEWAQNAGERYIRSEKELSYELDRLGYIRITPKNKRTWLGIALLQQNSAHEYDYDAVL